MKRQSAPRKEKADLHTPEELLSGAKALAEVGGPHFRRGAILEAITALESYVETLVFRLLSDRLDPLLVNFIKEKTKMDFDSRLTVLVPTATQLPIDKSAQLWSGYKRAKDIRNKVTHSGQPVTIDEVEEVLRTVYDWLVYLGYTGAIDSALIDLKNTIERKAEMLRALPAGDLENWIVQYFRRTGAARSEILGERRRGPVGSFDFDVVLQFGDKKVGLEIKRATKSIDYHQNHVSMLLERLDRLGALGEYDRVALIWISDQTPPEGLPSLTKGSGGRLVVLPVFLKSAA